MIERLTYLINGKPVVMWVNNETYAALADKDFTSAQLRQFADELDAIANGTLVLDPGVTTLDPLDKCAAGT